MKPRHALGLLMVLWGGNVGGCYYHRVEVASSDRLTERGGVPPTGKTGSATGWTFLYGGFHGGGITPEELAHECNNLPLREVTVRSNPIFFLITVVTLGAVAPARLEWHCTKATPVEDTLPAPPDSTGAGEP